MNCLSGFGASVSRFHDNDLELAYACCVRCVAYTQVAIANKRRGLQKHGYGSLLRDMGLATTPQQAGAINFLYIARQLFCVVT